MVSKDLKMGNVIITVSIYPEDPEVDLGKILEQAKKIIEEFGGKYYEHKETPIAFGLKSLDVRFIYPDQEFKEEDLISKLQEIEGVQSAEVTNITLASL